MISEINVKITLDTALAACIAANNLPTLQLENTRFKTTVNTAWIRSTLLPAVNNEISLGPNGFAELHGIYQIDAIYPNDAGASDALRTADIITNYFKRGNIYTLDGYVTTIMTTPSKMPARNINNYYIKAVEVFYSSVQPVT